MPLEALLLSALIAALIVWRPGVVLILTIWLPFLIIALPLVLAFTIARHSARAIFGPGPR